MIRLIRNPHSIAQEDKRTGLLPHTDYGTVTFLANVIGGLQILEPDHKPTDENGWKYVRPEPGCLIVNMGDAMVEWTGGVLRSNVHRVNFAPGKQAKSPQYSVGVLVRPAREVKMGRLVGGRIPTLNEDQRDGVTNEGEAEMAELSAIEWEARKALALKAGTDIARSRGGREMRPMIVA